MTPHQFIAKWKSHALTERASAQEHFLDLCELLDHPKPAEIDPQGTFFTFEKGASKTGGGDGFADVWKSGFFAWEYKKRRRDLDAAMKQLVDYAAALENPPLHVVCDTIRFRIETRWTNTVTAKHEFEIEALADPDKLALLRAVFHDPEALRPKVTRAQLTREAADKFQTISDRLQHRNPDREAVAHFVNQLVFCFFASSVGLLPEGLLRKLLDTAQRRPAQAKGYFDRLFAQMEEGGEFDLTAIRWFNGGLFDGRLSLALEPDEIGLLIALHSFRWDLIDPTIFGTLFERFLDPDKRAQIGAHYTDPDKIMMIVEPVVLRPLRAEWAETKTRIEAIMRPLLDEDARGLNLGRRFDAARGKAEAIRDAFVDRLCALRILDPACGSGNFLYLALQAVKDLEYRALLECEALLLGRVLPRVGPRILKGIEINPLAAELARTVIWIGDIQWGIRNGITHRPEPILEKLDGIECRDAILSSPPLGEVAGAERPTEGETRPDTPHPGSASPTRPSPPVRESEAAWPEADCIVGNPPFLGGKLLRRGLGDETVEALFRVYEGRVPPEADLVTYWFEKARAQIVAGKAGRAGLVSTNSIRGGANRRVLDRVAADAPIFEAWADEPWVVDGAAVRVSILCFGKAAGDSVTLDGHPAPVIHSDLTSGGSDFTQAERLAENVGVAFQGITKGAPFEVEYATASAWLEAPLNPNGRANCEVLRPIVSGGDIVKRRSPGWVIDFTGLSEVQATLFQDPFEFAKTTVKPIRDKNPRPVYRQRWWIFSEARPGFRAATSRLGRFIATPKVARHRPFVWLSTGVLPDNLVTE